MAEQEVGRTQEEIDEVKMTSEAPPRTSSTTSPAQVMTMMMRTGTPGRWLSVWDAADIWLSNGMDEDYMFGYTEEELRRAAEE